mgnify:CR=1 FL=1
MEAQTLLKELVEDMRQVAKTETVIGEPIEVICPQVIGSFGGATAMYRITAMPTTDSRVTSLYTPADIAHGPGVGHFAVP